VAARAQQPVVPVIGYFSARSLESDVAMLAAFRRGLNEAGYVEGRNVEIEFRWGGGQYDRLPALAAELVRRQVTVIATSGGNPTALAAKAATETIPIVFIVGGDPVQEGLVTSLSRPGGHLTGLSSFANALETKELELLHELVPKSVTIGMLLDANNTETEPQIISARAGARAVGLELIVLEAGTARDIEAAFATLVQRQVGALLVSTSPFYLTHPDQIIALAERHKMPTMYSRREYVEAGGLASYGTNQIDGYRQVGVYVGRIIKGEEPADLPVIQPTKFELVVNLKTAKAIGLTIPEAFLLRADEVIE
jgi:putative tryptophan/tyrosine transport system substrate-binding protein